MTKHTFCVGDLIIDSDQIHTVSKIDNDRLFYTPISTTNGCSGSIPVSNLVQACIRPLMSKSEIKSFLKNLSLETPLEVPFSSSARTNNNNFLKDILFLNNPVKTGRLLVYLSNLKEDSKLSSFDQDLFNQAVSHIAEEISIVEKTSQKSATQKILSAIKR